MPDLSLEKQIQGPVFGLDEVGRGPLAGPVVAACVYIPEDTYTLPFISEIRDSKTLSETKLEKLYGLITAHFEWRVVEIAPPEIDEINILQASLKAMKLACEDMHTQPNHALVDGNKLPHLACNATAVVKGDSKSTSIAAASIVAKVTRDRIMKTLHEEFPQYGWNSNVGYPAARHREAIDKHGITPHHRKSYAPIKNYLAFGSTRGAIDSAA
jgi:ribonuclease HII